MYYILDIAATRDRDEPPSASDKGNRHEKGPKKEPKKKVDPLGVYKVRLPDGRSQGSGCPRRTLD